MKRSRDNHIASGEAFRTGILLIVMIAGTVSAGDFSFYSIGRGLYYDQTGGGAPLVKAPYSGLFTAEVIPVSNYVTSVGVTLPTGGHVYLDSHFGSPYFEWDRTLNQAALEAAFPSGNYTFQIGTFHFGFVYVTNTMAPNAGSTYSHGRSGDR